MLTATASAVHPLQSELTFTFTDYQANANKQGVQKSEAENLIRTGLYMPVKVNYLGDGVGGHHGAVPIGPIISLAEVDDRLVGKAIVWRDEYADVVNYLETASKEDGGVQFSWELYYTDSEKDQNNVEWLKNCVVAAATIVDVPAYGGRTALISFAEEQRTLKDILERLEQIEQRIAPREGLMSAELDDKVEGQEGAEVEQTVGTPEASDGTAAPASDEAATLLAELEELRKFKQQTEAEAARAERVKTRKTKLSEAGIALSDDDFTARSALFVDLDDAVFASLVDFIGAVQKAKTGSTSSSAEVASPLIPDPTQGSDTVTVHDLASEFRKLAARGKVKKES